MSFAGALVGVLAGTLVAFAVGWAVSRFFTGGLTRPEKISWSFAAGLLVQAILFPILVSILPGRAVASLLALDAVLVAASLLARRPLVPPRPAQRENGRGEGRALVVSLLAIATAAWLVFLVSALSEPMWSTDYLAIWGFKAKLIATTGHVPARLFADPALFWSHREYPLLVPFSLAMLASFAGGWHDQALALFFPLCEFATLAALYGFLARRVSPLAGATAAALTSLCFPLYRAVNVGTAEVPLAFSLVLASTAFLDALSGRSRGVLARLAVASLFCVSIKQEGMIFVLLLAALLWLRRRWEGWLLVAPAAVHALLLRLLRGPQTHRDFDPTFLDPLRWGELARRLVKVVGEILTVEVLHSWLPLLAIVLLFLLTRRGLADPLLPVFFLQVLAYLVSFSISAFDPVWAAGVFPRLLMTLFPLFTLVIAARAGPSRERA